MTHIRPEFLTGPPDGTTQQTSSKCLEGWQCQVFDADLRAISMQMVVGEK